MTGVALFFCIPLGTKSLYFPYLLCSRGRAGQGKARQGEAKARHVAFCAYTPIFPTLPYLYLTLPYLTLPAGGGLPREPSE